MHLRQVFFFLLHNRPKNSISLDGQCIKQYIFNISSSNNIKSAAPGLKGSLEMFLLIIYGTSLIDAFDNVVVVVVFISL